MVAPLPLHFDLGGLGRRAEAVEEILLHIRKIDAILRALRSGQRRHHGRKIQRECIGEHRLGRAVDAEQALLFRVGFHQLDLLRRAIGHAQIIERSVVDGEHADGRAVFGRHVGDGGAIGQAQRAHAVAVEFDELADHAFLAQHLRDGEHQVGGGRAFGQLAGQLESDHGGQQHRGGLAEHARLGFNSADAPADHAEAVDHGGVRIGADHGIGIRGAVVVEDHRRKIFEIHLVHDAGIGRHRAEILERRLAPAQERIALLVALKFEQRVEVERVRWCRICRPAPSGRSPDPRGSAGWPSWDRRPSSSRASRMAARSTTQGTPVKSCKQHARRPEVDFAARRPWGPTSATYSMSERLTVVPSSKRSRFSSRILIEKGMRERLTPAFSSAARRKIS